MINESRTASSSKQRSPLVSIVTPSFNQAHFIDKTIRSVLLQDYLNLEYIVMDAMSSDGTAEIMANYANDGRMIREKDDGQSDAIDKGFRLCSGEIMAYLNSDDCYSTPKVVSRVVQLFEENPDVDVIIGKREFIDEAGYYVLNYPFRPFDSAKLLESCYVPQECAFWRRSIYEKAGDCVDKKFRFAMDYDLWLRFIAANANFLAVDEYFGLFRWYLGQKSTDIWQKHGVPEIAKLQKKHLGYAMPEDEMVAVYQEYWYGSNRLNHLDTYKHSVPTWQTFTSYKKELLRATTRDAWVYLEHLSIPKRNITPGVGRPASTFSKGESVANAGSPSTQVQVASEPKPELKRPLSLQELVKRYGAFDADFYRSQLQESVADPLEHFHTIGFRRALNPHPLFDTHYYLDKNADVKAAGTDPLEHWLKSGAGEGRWPHPVFDAAHLRAQDATIHSALDAFNQYQVRGWNSDLNPHILFNQSFYKQQRGSAPARLGNPLSDYLQEGFKLGFNPHELFSTRFYQSKLEGEASSLIEPLTHYLRSGSREGRDPHQLFDSAHFKSQKGDAKSTCLEEFLKCKETVDPHPAFSMQYYSKQAGIEFSKPADALIHYLDKGWKKNLNPYPLFDTQFYREKSKTNSKEGIDPLSHYLGVGYKDGRDPHPLFDTAHYLEQRPALKTGYMSPLTHYILRGLNYKTNPHPLFDTLLFESCEPESSRDDAIPAMVRYFECAFEPGVDPNESFDTDYYLEKNPSVRESRINPLRHYVEHKEAGGTASSPFYNPHFHIEDWRMFVESCKGRVIWNFEGRNVESEVRSAAERFPADTIISIVPTTTRYRGGSQKFRGLLFRNISMPGTPEVVFHPVRQIDQVNSLFDEINTVKIILHNFFDADQSLQNFLSKLKRPFSIFVSNKHHELFTPPIDEIDLAKVLCDMMDDGCLEVGTNFQPENLFNWKVSRVWFLENTEQLLTESEGVQSFLSEHFFQKTPSVGTIDLLISTISSIERKDDLLTSPKPTLSTKVLRLGIPCNPDSAWNGGTQYLNNFLRALKTARGPELRCVLLTKSGQDHRSLSSVLKNWDENYELTNWASESELASANLDCIFSPGDLFESAHVPVISWLYDFQHKELPSLFSAQDLRDRDRLFDGVVRTSAGVILSSNHAKTIFALHYPDAIKKVRVLQFVPLPPAQSFTVDERIVRKKYNLPDTFFYLPNQFWLHKNHECVIEALARLKKEEESPTVVCTGAINDARDPTYYPMLLNKIATAGIASNFITLGFVPKQDVLSLMKECRAVIQPSLYEGWSTSVEEAKALNKTIAVSDIPVHREQNPSQGVFFDPLNPSKLAEILKHLSMTPEESQSQVKNLAEQNAKRFIEFGQRAAEIIGEFLRC